MKAMMMTLAACLALSFGTTGMAHAEETVGEKVKEGWEDTKKNVKKTWRNAKGEMCEMVNGKAECVARRAKNSLKNTADEVKDKADIEQ